MQYYSAKLRLSGSTMNEVRGVYSAPEILLLQYIHGVDSVIEMKAVEKRATNMREYKDHLKAKYDSALVKRDQSVDKIFGALGQLPIRLPEHMHEQYDIVDEDDVIAVAKSATRSQKREQKTVPPNELEAQRLERFVPASEVSMDDIME
jgi:hypothetical protein